MAYLKCNCLPSSPSAKVPAHSTLAECNVTAPVEKSLNPRASANSVEILSVDFCKFFLWKHWILEKPGLFNLPGHVNELSQAVCEFNIQEPQELSDHSPDVQAEGAAPSLCSLPSAQMFPPL